MILLSFCHEERRSALVHLLRAMTMASRFLAVCFSGQAPEAAGKYSWRYKIFFRLGFNGRRAEFQRFVFLHIELA